MLRLAKLTDAEYVLGQVAAGLEDYYLGSGEAPGVWTGRLAGELGLAGVVDGDDLRALIDRRHPAGGEPLGGAKQPTVRAIDATFSAPKSVSLLWAFGTARRWRRWCRSPMWRRSRRRWGSWRGRRR